MRKIVKGDDGHRSRLEQAICTLWAPLDRVDAARPVLALWFDQPGWNCPFEARGAVSKDAPLRHLSVRWRALTLVILGDLFGAELISDIEMPERVRRLFSRAAPIIPRRQSRWKATVKEKNPIDRGTGRDHRLSMSPVHRLSGNFLDERADFGCRSVGISETAFHLFSIACLCRISETDSGYVRLDADLSHHW